MATATPQRSSSPARFDIDDYLAAEERAAKAAVGQTFRDMKAAARGEDPSPLTSVGDRAGVSATTSVPAGAASSIAATAHKTIDAHPILSLGGAAVAGFVAALALVPSKEQQVLKKLAALERAVALHGGDVHQPKPGESTLLGSLFGAVLGAVKPVVLNSVMAALAAQTPGDSGVEGVDAVDGVVPDQVGAGGVRVGHPFAPKAGEYETTTFDD